MIGPAAVSGFVNRNHLGAAVRSDNLGQFIRRGRKCAVRRAPGLMDHIDCFLRHGVESRDGLGVSFKSPLRDYEVGELS